MPDLFAPGPEAGYRSDHLGNDIACPTYDHRVADADVLAVNLVLVVQCGHANVCTADEDRFEDGERGGCSGPTDIDLDGTQRRGLFFRWELVGNSPAGRLGGVAKQGLTGEAVQFHHHTIGLIALAMAIDLGSCDVCFDSGEVLNCPGGRIYPQSEITQVFQGLPMPIEKPGRPAQSRAGTPISRATA